MVTRAAAASAAVATVEYSAEHDSDLNGHIKAMVRAQRGKKKTQCTGTAVYSFPLGQ